MIFSREVREPFLEQGKKRFSVVNENMEFVFPKEYSKMLSPVFSRDYDFDANEENGTITVILKPTPKETSITNPVECKKISTLQESPS